MMTAMATGWTLIHRCPRARRRFFPLFALAAAAALGCLFHTGVVEVKPGAQREGESKRRFSEEEIGLIVVVVENVATNEGFHPKRAAGVPFGSKLLAYYASEEQISMAVLVARDSRSISIRLRDVNNLRETDYLKRLRRSIESGIRAELPDIELSYGATR